jgi:GT2 family glycosyltransferase
MIDAKVQIFAVVVLYKREPAASETVQTLAAAFADEPELLNSVPVLVWDNSPAPLVNPDFGFPCIYKHGQQNVGTSGAYNFALQLAIAEQRPWLLLLDQDTRISAEFLHAMLGYAAKFMDAPEIAAVSPFIFSHGELVSPRLLLSFNRVRQIPVSFSGLCKDKAYAVNSATLMRVSALQEVGGYSEEFWLDLSDVFVFQAMHRKGRYLYIAGDIRVDHSIASMDFDREMSPERYRNFSAAESAYIDLFSSHVEQAAQLFRLSVRTVRQYVRYENKIFARISWEYLCQRLFHRRAARIHAWQKQLARRDIPSIKDGHVNG